MHMRWNGYVTLLAAFAIGGCGEPSVENDAAGASDLVSTDDSPSASGENVLFTEEMNDSAELETEAKISPCPEGAFCDGPLTVNAERLNLIPENSRAQLNAVFSLDNRSTSDLQVVLMDEQFTGTLDNGVSGRMAAQRASGLDRCRKTGTECYASTPEFFRLISPDDSPTRISATIPLRYDAAMVPAMKEAAVADISFQLFSVSASGEQRLHQVTIANAALQNQM